ncbi:MAG: hypothetical protein R2809_05620 [Flavobacteriales bacterium]
MMNTQQFNAPDGTITIEAEDEVGSYRIVMKKTSIFDRPTSRIPKK